MKIRYILLMVCVYIIAKIIIVEKFDKSPFKFYKYKTPEAFENEIRTRFPNGSDMGEAVEILQHSGASCYVSVINNNEIDPRGIIPGAKFDVSCEYEEVFISLRPYACYRVFLTVDEDLKILRSGVQRINNCGAWVI